MRTQIKVNGEWVDGTPQLGEWYKKEVALNVWQEHHHVLNSLSDAKDSRILRIKSEARVRIESTDWELERVRERKEQSQRTQDDVNSILDTREQIRTDSNNAEIALNALTTVEEVESFLW